MKHELPAILAEVSGLTDIDSSHVACVQDELGIVFIYNFRTGEIVSEHSFDETGDFEGLAYTGEAIFILRSDGRLTEWRNFQSNSAEITHYELPLLTDNNEGLCFDQKHNRILIAAKSKPRDRGSKSKRLIYAFDLSRKELLDAPLYTLDTEQLDVRAQEFGILTFSLTKKGKKKPFNFRPASLAIHPLSDDIYIVSAVDNMLVIMNRQGEVGHIEKLDPRRFAKAEGITFLPDGTMIITNEAAGGFPTLLAYRAKNGLPAAVRSGW